MMVKIQRCLFLFFLFSSTKLFAEDIVIKEIQPAYEGYYRIGLWQSVKITVSTQSGFDGALYIKTDTNLKFGQRLHLIALSEKQLVLPALFCGAISSLTVIADNQRDCYVKQEYGGKLHRLNFDELLVGVDIALSSEVTQKLPDVSSYRFDTKNATQGFLEPVSVIIASKEPPLNPHWTLWKLYGGKVVLGGDEEALREIHTSKKPHCGFVSALNRNAYQITSNHSWAEQKRQGGIIVILIYFVVIFLWVVLFLNTALKKQWFYISLFLTSLIFTLYLLWHMPKGDISIKIYKIALEAPEDQFGVSTFWFVRAHKDGQFSLRFPSLVKPVFREINASNTDFTLMFDEDGRCEVKDFKLQRGQTQCFVSEELATVSLREDTASSSEKDSALLASYASQRFQSPQYKIVTFPSVPSVESDDLVEVQIRSTILLKRK